jgi:hypothetical protein
VPLQQQQAYSRASSRFNPAYLGGSGEIPHADHTVVSMHGQDRQIELGAMGSHDDRSLPGGYKLEEESQLGSSRVQSPSAREGGEVALSLAMLPSLPQLRATLEDGLLNSPQVGDPVANTSIEHAIRGPKLRMLLPLCPPPSCLGNTPTL